MTPEDFQEEIFNSLETVRLAQFGHCLGRFHSPFTQYRIKIFLETSHLFSFDCFSEKMESFFSNSLMNGMANFLLQRETKRTKIGTPGSSRLMNILRILRFGLSLLISFLGTYKE